MKIRISIVGKARNNQSGFTYILVLIALVVVGILVEVTVIPTSQKIKRDKEAELLFRGMAYQQAIQSYYEAVPSFKQYPKHLDDLLLDNRVAYARHIRRLYTDPFNEGEWQLVRNNQGGITGVVSSNTGAALKQTGFPNGFELFESAEHYSDWVFEYRPQLKIKK